jgi:hypothetical protein
LSSVGRATYPYVPHTGANVDFDTSTKIGNLRKIVLDLLREHEAAGDDGLPTNGRFLFYELVQRGVLKKHDDDGKAGGRRADQDLHDALTYLREKGIVPWDWIEDETRSLDDYTGWSSIKAWGVTSVKYVRLDPWRGRQPLILTESRAVRGALRKLADRYAVRLAPTGGQVAGLSPQQDRARPGARRPRALHRRLGLAGPSDREQRPARTRTSGRR